MKKISIAIICYNQEKFIKDTIENCLNQTYKNIEICISDDCSTDNTYNIILDYKKKYPNIIKCFQQKENMWKYSLLINFKTVLDLCNWDYLALCEGDDYWIDSNKLQIQVDALKKHKNCDLCFHSAYELIWKNKWKLLWKNSNWNKIFWINKIIMWDWWFCPTASLVFRRKSINKLPVFFDKLPVWDYFLQILWALNWWALYIDKPMSIYRVSSIWSWSKSIEIIEKKEKFLIWMLDGIDLMNNYLNFKYNLYFKFIKFKNILALIKLYYKNNNIILYKKSINKLNIKWIFFIFYYTCYLFLVFISKIRWRL